MRFLTGIRGLLQRFSVAVTSTALLGFALVVFCFTGEKGKYTRTSNSSGSAKWRRLFLGEVELDRLDPTGDKPFFAPTEAWLEAVFENYESIPLRKQIAGERLCIRFQESSGIRIGGRFELSVDGQDRSLSMSWSKGNVTFDWESHTESEIPSAGELTIRDRKDGRESRFRYRIKRSRGTSDGSH